MLHSKQCGTANLAHRRITAVLLLLRPPQSRSWLRAARRPMSALAAKPSPEEIERRRRAKRAERAANPKKKVQQTQKKQRDPAEEAKALREFRIAPLIDAGANLQSRGSYDDVVRQLQRASLAGVAAVVLTGCDVDGSTAGKDFCERWAAEGSTLQLGFTAGVHPHDASKFTDGTLSKLEALSTSPFCVAMGECGLDYDRMFSPREVQLAAFRAQCALAKRLDRSLFVHVREKEEGEALGAYRDAVAVMTEAQLIPEKVCVHCFTGGTDELAALVDFGCRVGFTGFLGIAKRSGATREAVASLKDRLAGRLLLETDAPFMLPDKTYLPSSLQKRLGLRGGKNEPAVLPAVCGALAALADVARGRDASDVARETTGGVAKMQRKRFWVRRRVQRRRQRRRSVGRRSVRRVRREDAAKTGERRLEVNPRSRTPRPTRAATRATRAASPPRRARRPRPTMAAPAERARAAVDALEGRGALPTPRERVAPRGRSRRAPAALGAARPCAAP